MPINIDKQKIIVNKNIIKGAVSTWIEQDLLVPDTKPDVMKIIRVDGNVYITSTEVMNGSIRVSGQIAYYIIYTSEEGEVRGINTIYPFVKVIEDKNITNVMRIRIKPVVKNIIYSVPNERKIAIKTEVLFKYKLSEIGEVEILNRIDDCKGLECKKVKDSFFNIIEYKKETFDTREDIMIPEGLPAIYEILRVSTDIVNAEYKVSYNKILIKGEIKTTIIYTAINDNKEIYSYETNIPFTGMVEFSNISDSSKFDIQYLLKNFDVTLDTSSENPRMINISAEVIADVMMYEEKELEYIEDFYSMEDNLEYDKNNVSIIKNKEKIEKNISLKDNIGVVPDGARLLDYTVDISNLTTKISGSNVYINGNIKINLMYEVQDNRKVESKTFDMLVDTVVELPKDVDEKYVNVNLELIRGIVRLNGNSLEADIEMVANIDVDNVENINQIGNIKEEKIDTSMFDSMNIYIVKKGDNLWDIAKKYKTSVAKIANINDLSNENKLDVGQKILIIR